VPRSLERFSAVVLKLGSMRQFFGVCEAPSKKINTTLLKKKILCKIKFLGNLFFQTKLSKHNLELWSNMRVALSKTDPNIAKLIAQEQVHPPH